MIGLLITRLVLTVMYHVLYHLPNRPNSRFREYAKDIRYQVKVFLYRASLDSFAKASFPRVIAMAPSIFLTGVQGPIKLGRSWIRRGLALLLGSTLEISQSACGN